MKRILFLILSIILILFLVSCSGQKTEPEKHIEDIETKLEEGESKPYETMNPEFKITGLIPDREKGYAFRDFVWGDTPEFVKGKFKDIPYSEEPDTSLYGSVSLICREIILDQTATVVYRFYEGLFFVSIELKPVDEDVEVFFQSLVTSFIESYGEPAESQKNESGEKFTAAAWKFGIDDYFLLGTNEEDKSILITYFNPERLTEYKNIRDNTADKAGIFSDIYENMKTTELKELLKLEWGSSPEKIDYFGHITKKEIRETGRSAVITQTMFQDSVCYLQYLFIDKMLCHLSIIVPLPVIPGMQQMGQNLYETAVKQIEIKNGQSDYTDSEVAKKWWILSDGSTLTITLNRRSDSNEIFIITLQEELLFAEYEKTE